MKVILIDDEILALDYLELQINKLNNLEVVGKFTHIDLKEKSSLLKELDVVFLDIEMPKITGIELAERILEINPRISIIFVTAYAHYAVEAFDLDALDYVLKPVDLERLKKTIKRIESKKYYQMPLPKKTNTVLKINVSSELSFYIEEDKPELITWRTTKTQELFLYLLHHRHNTVRKSELIELLWPELNQDKAYSQLYTAIYHVRKSLKKYNDYFIIKNIGEGYNLTTKQVLIDLIEWEDKISTMSLINNQTINEYESIMSLYKGSYLQAYNYLWAENERYRLEQLWLKIAFQLANYLFKQNNLEKAEMWYVKICKISPEHEDARFILMKLYAKQELNPLVKLHYYELDKELKELDLEMRKDIKAWYTQWKNIKALQTQ
ncbi:response regulator [Bacillus weihaiensis]|uniref:response regulator n=1 Tax=Bacillus weihaiensis TaxID=1547283 RepID=UPI002357CDBB|nr:response regulator [Bacillus weihaiensis]